MTNTIEPLIPEKQAEREANLPHDSLRYHRRGNKPPPFVKIGKRYFYRRSDFLTWLSEGAASGSSKVA